ncbi:MAG: hypothetical protein E7166_06725 [Firmicutes bacterium]|nr:hypothetical protein [Bacillota bacterium]
MKKIIKVFFPSVIMLMLIFLWRDGKDILNGIYIAFPIIYIVLGIISSDIKSELLISLILISITFLIPINLMFNMGTCIELVIIYTILSCICYFIKRKIKK